MTAQSLAEQLVERLRQAGVEAGLGAPIPYGHAVSVSCAGRSAGALKVYCGKKGPNLAHNELRGPHASQLRVQAEAAFAAVMGRGAEATEPGVHAWVDGSFLGGACGWAYIIACDGSDIQQDSGVVPAQEVAGSRNVAGELTATLQALTWCRDQGIAAVTVHHDYEGLEAWVTGRWRAKQELTRHYVDAVRALGIETQWVKVTAHTGEKRNELVDRLAKQAAAVAATGAPPARDASPYELRLLELARRWRHYGPNPGFDWSGLRAALAALAAERRLELPRSPDDPTAWCDLAECLAKG